MNPLIIDSVDKNFRLGIQPLIESGGYLTFAVAISIDLTFYKERILKAYFWPNKLEDFLIRADEFISIKQKAESLRLETPDSFFSFRFDRPKLSNFNVDGLCLYLDYSVAGNFIGSTKSYRYSSNGEIEVRDNTLSTLVHFFREAIVWSENKPEPTKENDLLSSLWLSFNG